MNINCIISALLLPLAASCGSKPSAAADVPAYSEQGAFSADSAYEYVKRQVDFGPRVPGTAPHRACADWLTATLHAFGADTVIVSGMPVEAWDGTMLPVRNILARYNTSANKRVLLVAHYDTRPWADQDPDPGNRMKPIDGANDGASGVGVLLEVARNLGIRRPDVGVDILLADCEDYGVREGSQTSDTGDSWCLGTQQFAGDLPYTAATMPRYGILLDMVGGRGARFNREYFSASSAQLPTARVWDMARKLGLADVFPMAVGGAITDDHLPLIRAGIPTTDIIENASPSTGSFNPTWHTLADNIDNIDPESLAAAGRVTLNVVYNEKND
ncbi:MAG: M28 family peptidase [Muribaculaceae bacterium]|nr:M28 family peptidase [Muribaculaceae bacterium]